VTAVDQARSLFEAGDYAAAREVAAEGLRSGPDDVELLRIAGCSGVEMGSPEALDQLRRVAELAPEDARSWHDLGDALATDGRTDEASDAFRKALDLDPNDELAMTHLGHSAFQSGKGDEGVKLLEQAAERVGGNSTAAISLVDMYRSLGQNEEALAAAVKVADADPDDPLYALDVAELSLENGKLDEAATAFDRLREIVEGPEQEVWVLHGAILVALERDDAPRALELARDAFAIDTMGRTAGVIGHLEVETGADPAMDAPRDASAAHIAAQGVPPTRQEVDQALRESLRELRLFQAEDRHVIGGEPLG